MTTAEVLAGKRRVIGREQFDQDEIVRLILNAEAERIAALRLIAGERCVALVAFRPTLLPLAAARDASGTMRPISQITSAIGQI